MAELTEAQREAWVALDQEFGPARRVWKETTDDEYGMLCIEWPDGRRRYLDPNGTRIGWTKIVDETASA